MGELIRFETGEMPAVRVIGKQIRYSMDALMQGDNRISALWDRCFQDGTFEALEAMGNRAYDPSYVGVMLDWDLGDGDFTYVCGMLMLKEVEAPEGFVSHQIDAARVAIAYIRGTDIRDVCDVAHQQTEQALREKGYTNAKMRWCMELYNCPRFTQPDEAGRVTLDYYIPLDA